MSNRVIFYRFRKEDGWRFGGFTELNTFDVSNFRLDNPNGDALAVDLDMLSQSRSKKPVWSEDISADEKVVMTTVHLDDGRVVDVFPTTGGVQVYTEDRKRGYELTLPEPEKAYDPVEAGCGLVELRRIG